MQRIFILGLILLLTGCGQRQQMRYVFVDSDNNQYRGRWLTQASNALPKRIEGKSGVLKGWYPDGTLFMECSYSNGLRHGSWKMWKPDGTFSGETKYEHGYKVK
jgi:antitoxin component YwqK of YwqJK toxin-antitoxin module